MIENKELMLKYFKYTLKEFLKLKKEGVFLGIIQDYYRFSFKIEINSIEIKIKNFKINEKSYFIYNLKSFNNSVYNLQCSLFYPKDFFNLHTYYNNINKIISYKSIKEFINIYEILNYNENNYNDKINKAMFIGFLKLVIYLNKNNKMEYLL